MSHLCDCRAALTSTRTHIESPAAQYHRSATASSLETASALIDRAIEAASGNPASASRWTGFHMRSAAFQLERSAELLRGIDNLHGYGVDAMSNAAESAHVLANRHSTASFVAVDATSDISWLQRSFSFDAGRVLALVRA